MVSVTYFLSLSYQFIFLKYQTGTIAASWPSYNHSVVQILGLFHDITNSTVMNSALKQSRIMFKAAVVLAHEYNITINNQPIGWSTVQTKGDVSDAVIQSCHYISTSNTIGIIGPFLSREAHLLASFTDRIGIPIISYGATDPDLSEQNSYQSFYRTVPSDDSAALALAHLFIHFEWTSCIIIFQDDDFGKGGEKSIRSVFRDYDLKIDKLIEFNLKTSSIRGNLSNQFFESQTRLVIVWAESFSTQTILIQALRENLVGPRFTWILSSRVAFDNFPLTSYAQLSGILIIEPTTADVVNVLSNKSLLHAAMNIWQKYEPETYSNRSQLNHYAMFAFDATWALIEALQLFCSSNNQLSPCLSLMNSPVCFHRKLVQSSAFLQILESITFIGISGSVSFTKYPDKKMLNSHYALYNVQDDWNNLNIARVLTYSLKNRWTNISAESPIIWPGNSRKPPASRSTLYGIPLRIGVIETRPFLFVHNQTYRTGFVIDLIEALRRKLNFTAELFILRKNTPYSKIIQLMANHTYDLFVGDVTITAGRRKLVEFSNSIFDNSLRIIMRKSNNVEIDLLSFLRPFSFKLWWSVLTTCIYAGILLCIMERSQNESLQDRPILSQLMLSIWYAFGNMVGYGVEFHARTAAGRLLTTGLYILSLILVASYTANLASQLTVMNRKDDVSDFNDLIDGKIPWNKVGIRVETAAAEFFAREVPNGNNKFFQLYSDEEIYQRLLDESIDAALIDTGLGEYVTNNIYCNLTLAIGSFDKSAFGIVIPKDWSYTQELDVAILDLRETGFLDELKEKWFETKSCSDFIPSTSELSVESIGGLFLTFGVISSFSLILFCVSKRKYAFRFLQSTVNKMEGYFASNRQNSE